MPSTTAPNVFSRKNSFIPGEEPVHGISPSASPNSPRATKKPPPDVDSAEPAGSADQGDPEDGVPLSSVITSIANQDPNGNGAAGGGVKRHTRSFIENICCCIWSPAMDDKVGGDLVVESNLCRPKRELLGDVRPNERGRICLVLDLDETLVHSSFREVPNADYIVPVVMEGVTHNVYVSKRPGVDEFLQKVGPLFEVVVFTASLQKYADPLLDLLDVGPVPTIGHRLFRQSCTMYRGNYVKDLAQLNRPLESTIIVDNSPISYCFQPENAIDVTSYVGEYDDELERMGAFLEKIRSVTDVRAHVKHWRLGSEYVLPPNMSKTEDGV